MTPTNNRPGARSGRPVRPGRSALALLERARHGLADAANSPYPPDRYAAAHRAALQGAAAILAARCEPELAPQRRRRPTSAWVLLREAAPELGEWAAFFAANARTRAAAEIDLPGWVTSDEANRLVRDVGTFLSVVETTLGLVPALGGVP